MIFITTVKLFIYCLYVIEHYQYHSQAKLLPKTTKKNNYIKVLREEEKFKRKKNLIDSFIFLHTQKLPLSISAKIIVVATTKERSERVDY